MRDMLNNVFSCCIHIEEQKHDLEIVLGAFYAERLVQIAFEASQEWPGETAENVLSRMLDDALRGMDGKSICEKWLGDDA